MQVDADARAYEAVLQHPRASDLATIAQSVMTAAAQVKRVDNRPDHLSKLAAEMRLSREESATPFGNALDVLERGPGDDAERALACALAAHAVALFPPKDHDGETRLANELLWLAAHTPFDATGLLDRALGEGAAGLWEAIAERVRRMDRGPLAATTRGEALVGGAALACSSASAAAKLASALASEVQDRKLARVLGASRAVDPVEPVLGELAPCPRRPLTTVVLALTGVLLAMHTARLFARVALAYKAPAQVLLFEDGDGGGLRVRFRVELLGRTLRDRDVMLPRASLQRATREILYPRFAFYAGLLALAVGSWIGASAFIDGVRAASPSLLVSGIIIVALGVGLDFALSSVAPAMRGRCRLLFVPRQGATLCVGSVDARRADALLARLAR
jgi:hypothetical protein